MAEKYQETNISFDIEFSASSESIFNADLLITDWSAINFEYAFTTGKPVISVNTPMKVMNPEYEKLGIEPYTIWARNTIGETIEVEDVKNIDALADKLLSNSKKYQKQIFDLRKKSIYNLGKSVEAGGEYIVKCIQDKIKERKNNE